MWVPFPHVEDNRLRSRPAVVIATALAGPHELCWALMVTSADNEAWPEDVAIDDHHDAGLPIPSSVRTAKIATLPAASATYMGRLPAATWQKVQRRFVETTDLGRT